MKISKPIVLVILLISLLAITVASQIPQVANTISVEEAKACNIVFYDEMQDVYKNYSYYYNYTQCLNTSGPNTGCSTKQDLWILRGKIGQVAVAKNITECKPVDKFIVSINKGSVMERKEIDFSSWGVCINTIENDCLAITCGTLKGGSARNGIFNGCDGGKSCQKFLFCQDSVKVLYKASRDDFVREDPTFKLSKLELREASK